MIVLSFISSSNMNNFLLRILVFLLIPFLLIEIFSRLLVGPDWYEHTYLEMSAQAAASPTAVLLLGSSYTAAALDQDYLSQKLTDSLGRRIQVFNLGVGKLGLGKTTMAMYYFDLKHLLKQRKTLQDVAVIIEAPHGYPRLSGWSGSWSSEWHFEQLIPLLDSHDILQMWKKSSMPVRTKAQITLSRYLVSFRYFDRYRRWLFFLPSQLLRLDTKTHQLGDIFEAGGIASNAVAILTTRMYAKSLPEHAAQMKQEEEPDRAFLTDDTIFCDLATLCHMNGAKILTYVPPESSVDQNGLSCLAAPALRTAYDTYRRQNGIAIISTNMKFSDADFPDLVHIGISGRNKFTRQFAACLLEELRRLQWPG